MLSVEADDGRVIAVKTPPADALRLSLDNVDELSFELWKLIHASGLEFDTGLFIGRGGLAVGNIVLRCQGFEGKDFQHLGMTSYLANSTDRDGGRFQIGQRSVKIGGRWIVVDEVGETCESLAVVHDQLTVEHEAERVHTGVLYDKPTRHSILGRAPDFAVETTEKWIVFPWEKYDVIGVLVRERVGELALKKALPQIEEYWGLTS